MKLGKKDAAIIALISALFISLAAFNIGQTHIPVTPWRVQQDILYLGFDQNTTITSLYLLVDSDQNVTASFSVPAGGGWSDRAWINSGGYYKWLRVDIVAITDRLRLNFYLPAGDILEVVAVDDAGGQVGLRDIRSTNPGDVGVPNLIDEQGYFGNPPTYLSETYFDEIYFVRAAQEYTRLQEPIGEESHPPLGKLIIEVGIQAFSFGPLGWRILGIVFATLMIPVIYLLSLAMFKTRAAATIAAGLLSLDFMHFTMARVGTVDTFLVFFSLLSALFLYLNFERMTLSGEPSYRLILLGVISFWLAFSVKWTAVFGLIGQAALFLIVALRGSGSMGEAAAMLRSLAKPVAVVVGLIAVGGLVYLASFIPYALIGHGLVDVYNAQWYMLSYHSMYGGFYHPNASNWYEWPTILKPLLLYLGDLPGGVVSTITVMGNPVVWWVGLCAVLIALVNGVRREWPHLFIGVLFLAQLLPYALISRYLFIYHYYPNVPILALAIAGVTHELWSSPKGRRYVVLLVAAATAIFALFYPVISGYPIPSWYIDYLRWFRFWIF